MSDFLDSYLTTGGIDDQAVTLRNAKFTVDIAFRDGQEPFLCVDIIPDDPDVTALEEQRIGLGSGWEASDDESEVTRIDGKKPAFNTGSKIGRLLDSIGKADGFKTAVEGRIKAGDTPAAPTHAAFWEGIKGVIKRNEGSFKSQTGEDVTFSYYTFDTFDGWEGQGEAKAKPAKKAAAKKAAAKKAAAKKPEPKVEVEVEEPVAVVEEPVAVVEVEASGGGIDEFKAKLVDHCKATSAEEHADWMLEAYEQFADELTAGGDEYQALVDDEGAVWTEVWG